MKTIKKIALGLAAVLMGVLFTACPTPQGQITIIVNPSNDTTVQPGQTITWNVTLIPDSTQSSALGAFYVLADADTVYQTDFQGATDTKTFQLNFTVPQDAQNGQVITVSFVAIDAKSGLSSSTSVKLTVNAETYVEATDITLTYVSTSLDNQMMLVLTKDGVTLDGGNSTVGQIAYMYNGATNILNTLASPNAYEIADAYSYNGITYTTDDKQVTFLKRVTSLYTNWDDITQADCENISLDETSTDYISGSSSLGYGVSTLAVGDIIEFYNPQTNVKGFIKVNSFSTAKGEPEKATTTLNVDVKYIVLPTTTAK